MNRAAEMMLTSTYMDYSMSSVTALDEAIQITADLKPLWGMAEMKTNEQVTNIFELFSTF